MKAQQAQVEFKHLETHDVELAAFQAFEREGDAIGLLSLADWIDEYQPNRKRFSGQLRTLAAAATDDRVFNYASTRWHFRFATSFDIRFDQTIQEAKLLRAMHLAYAEAAATILVGDAKWRFVWALTGHETNEFVCVLMSNQHVVLDRSAGEFIPNPLCDIPLTAAARRKAFEALNDGKGSVSPGRNPLSAIARRVEAELALANLGAAAVELPGWMLPAPPMTTEYALLRRYNNGGLYLILPEVPGMGGANHDDCMGIRLHLDKQEFEKTEWLYQHEMKRSRNVLRHFADNGKLLDILQKIQEQTGIYCVLVDRAPNNFRRTREQRRKQREARN